LNIIDTPGLIEGGYINEQAVEIIKRFLLGKTIDVLLYVDRLDAYRMDTLDDQVIRAVTNSFGKAIWRRTLVVLTHAQLSPPDGLDYNDFFTKRSESLLRYIRAGAGVSKRELGDFPLRIALVENSGRCKTNENGEKVLPDGTPWIPNLMKEITTVVSNGSKSIHVDQKLIDGPNPNNRWKMFIPLILMVEYFLVVKGIRRAIHADISNGKLDDWEQRYRDLVGSKDPVDQKGSSSGNRKA
jgi:GTP-binding protein